MEQGGAPPPLPPTRRRRRAPTSRRSTTTSRTRCARVVVTDAASRPSSPRIPLSGPRKRARSRLSFLLAGFLQISPRQSTKARESYVFVVLTLPEATLRARRGTVSRSRRLDSETEQRLSEEARKLATRARNYIILLLPSLADWS